MWIVSIAWLYVTLTMSLAEATNPQGTVLGAVITFAFYGLAPLALVLYLMGTPARRRSLRAAEARAHAQRMTQASPDSAQTDAGSLPASDAISSERKKP